MEYALIQDTLSSPTVNSCTSDAVFVTKPRFVGEQYLQGSVQVDKGNWTDHGHELLAPVYAFLSSRGTQPLALRP